MKQDQAYLYSKLQKIGEDREALLKVPIKKFAERLIKDKIFGSERDLKLFILEYVINAFNSGTDWPIRYYENDEEPEPLKKEDLDDDISDFAKNNIQENFFNK